MEFTSFLRRFQFLLTVIYTMLLNSKGTCSNLQTGPKTETCADKYIDNCNVLTLLEGIDKLHKGIQLETQGQLADLDNKMTNIMLKLDPCSSNPCVQGKCSKFDDVFRCTCHAGYTGTLCDNKVIVTDCYDLRYTANVTRDGVYKVQLWRSNKTVEVFCDMTTDGGGWTVFQNRYNGALDFYKTFKEYEDGFGDVYEEFWLGLQNIEELSSQSKTQMRLDLTASDDSRLYESYNDFRLSSTSEYYLQLSKGCSSSENATFRMMLYNGYAFTTPDRDFDLDTPSDFNTQEDSNCGTVNHSGWWYGYCKANHYVNLNGEYCQPGQISTFNGGYGGMMYRDFKGFECLKSSKMMLRKEENTT